MLKKFFKKSRKFQTIFAQKLEKLNGKFIKTFTKNSGKLSSNFRVILKRSRNSFSFFKTALLGAKIVQNFENFDSKIQKSSKLRHRKQKIFQVLLAEAANFVLVLDKKKIYLCGQIA